MNLWNQILKLFCTQPETATKSENEFRDRQAPLEDFEPDPAPKLRIRVLDVRPLTSLHEDNELLIALEKILCKQDTDAERRIRESWCYLHTGYVVQKAAFEARDAIIRSLDEAISSNSLNPILLAVAHSKAEFLEYNDDDEAFGAATFNEILSDLLALQIKRGEDSRYTYEELSSYRNN